MMKVRLTILFSILFASAKVFAVDAVLYNGSGASAENKLIAMTIAGIVNREAPRLYLLNVYETWSYSQTDEKWRDIYAADGGVNFATISGINELVQHFSSYLKGAISYDPALTYGNFSGQNFRWQAEVAAMIGGLGDCIPVPYNNTSISINKPDSIWIKDNFSGQDSIRISAKLEHSSHSWNNQALSQEQRYFLILDWALQNLLNHCNPRKFYLREITDWAIGQRMFQMNLAGTESLNFNSLSSAKAEKIEQVMQYMQSRVPDSIFHVYGWMRPEPLVQWISAWGGSFHETLLGNLSWHHIFPSDTAFTYDRPAFVLPGSQPLENKYYVIFIGSEGDAGNWNFGFQAGAWHSGSRGNVPLAWGFNLHMFETFPFVGQYYYRTATANDGFISVITPLGYAYPDMFPASYLPGAVQKTADLLQTYRISSVYAYKHYNGAGVSVYRGIEISNNYNFSRLGEFAAATGTDLTFLFDPGLQTQQAYQNYGGLLYNHVNDETFYANVQDMNAVANRILNKLRNKPKPGFLLAGYQRLRQDGTTVGGSNPADVTLPRLQTIMQYVLTDPEIGPLVEFVTPEKFSDLLRQKLGINPGINEAHAHSDQVWISYNPAGEASACFRLTKPQEITVSIYDISGKLLVRTQWHVTSEFESRLLPLQQFSRGVYIVNLTTSGLNRSLKLLK